MPASAPEHRQKNKCVQYMATPHSLRLFNIWGLIHTCGWRGCRNRQLSLIFTAPTIHLKDNIQLPRFVHMPWQEQKLYLLLHLSGSTATIQNPFKWGHTTNPSQTPGLQQEKKAAFSIFYWGNISSWMPGSHKGCCPCEKGLSYSLL